MAVNFKNYHDKVGKDAVDIYLHGEIIDDSNKFFMKMFDINEGFVLPCDIREQLQKFKGKPLNVYINSPGGEVASGLAIANMLARHDAPVTAYIDGVAASMASCIFLSCPKRVMPSNALLMIHRPICTLTGNVDELLSAATVLETVGRGMLTSYIAAAKKGVAKSQIEADMKAETWYTAEDAAKLFDIEIINQKKDMQMAACAAFNGIYQHIPEALKAVQPAQTAANAVTNKQKAYIKTVLSATKWR